MRTYEDDVIDTKGLYRYVTNPEGDEMHIEIIRGPFKGIIYRYGKVGFNPEDKEDEERLTLAYEYDIISLPEHLQKQEIEDEQFYFFENMLGDILVEILEHDLESKRDNDARENHTQTPIH